MSLLSLRTALTNPDDFEVGTVIRWRAGEDTRCAIKIDEDVWLRYRERTTLLGLVTSLLKMDATDVEVSTEWVSASDSERVLPLMTECPRCRAMYDATELRCPQGCVASDPTVAPKVTLQQLRAEAVHRAGVLIGLGERHELERALLTVGASRVSDVKSIDLLHFCRLIGVPLVARGDIRVTAGELDQAVAVYKAATSPRARPRMAAALRSLGLVVND